MGYLALDGNDFGDDDPFHFDDDGYNQTPGATQSRKRRRRQLPADGPVARAHGAGAGTGGRARGQTPFGGGFGIEIFLSR